MFYRRHQGRQTTFKEFQTFSNAAGSPAYDDPGAGVPGLSRGLILPRGRKPTTHALHMRERPLVAQTMTVLTQQFVSSLLTRMR